MFMLTFSGCGSIVVLYKLYRFCTRHLYSTSGLGTQAGSGRRVKGTVDSLTLRLFGILSPKPLALKLALYLSSRDHCACRRL